MRISLNWLKKFVDIKISDEELISLIGSRLVEVEDVIDETHKYDNIIVAKVNSAEKIPDTHLTLCQVYDGKKEAQVICGAPNVHAGMLAAWIQPGAIVPASVHEDAPFVMGKRRMLKKYDSTGMLAGADELDFGDDHSGIVEIDPDEAEPGQPLAEIFDLNDKILDIENKSLTHRPDCFGVIGFAREVAGILGEKFVEPKFEELSISKKPELKIVIEDSEICSRYTAVVLQKHGELKKKYLSEQDVLLSKSGMRPISPIVDATNYLMLLTGQPLHAFDYDKFTKICGTENPEIRVRLAKNGEKLKLLDDEEVELNSDDIVICAGKTPVALAGAMGGESTEIDKDTKNIILESATFSLYHLRKTQMSHGIFSEAITRFTKGQPNFQTLKVATAFAENVSDGFRVFEVADKLEKKSENISVKLKISDINRLLGTNYEKAKIAKTLSNVGFEVKTSRGDEISVAVPAWRTDIHIPEDIIEEVGRLLGFDNIPTSLPLHSSALTNPMFDLKHQIRDELSRFGANEVLTYSFVSDRLLKKAGLDPEKSFKIVNSISPELQRIRQSIIPSLLEKTFANIKIPFDEFALFEMNQVYSKDGAHDEDDVPAPRMKLGFVIAKRKSHDTAFYSVKKYVFELLKSLGCSGVEFRAVSKTDDPFVKAEVAPFEPKRSAEVFVDEKRLGIVGEFKNSVRKNFKLENFLAGFEIDLDALLNLEKNHRISNDFSPRIKRDLTIGSEKTYADVVNDLRSRAKKLGLAPEIIPAGIYQPENSPAKNFTVHLEFPSSSSLSKIAKLLSYYE